MSLTVARWSLEEYHRAIAADVLRDRRVELLDGWIVERSPEGPLHSDLNTDLQEVLFGLARGRYRVRTGKPLAMPRCDSEPEPDLALVKPQSYRQSHPTPAAVYLVVEFAHTSLAKDRDEKRQLYAAAGIGEYWLVNLRDCQLLVYREPEAGDYRSQQTLTEGKVAPLAFPDASLSVVSLLGLEAES